MIEDAASIYNGKSSGDTEYSHSVKEHVVASEYGWTLEYIRSMKYTEFNKHFTLCLVKKKIEIGTQLAFMGVKNLGA